MFHPSATNALLSQRNWALKTSFDLIIALHAPPIPHLAQFILFIYMTATNYKAFGDTCHVSLGFTRLFVQISLDLRARSSLLGAGEGGQCVCLVSEAIFRLKYFHISPNSKMLSPPFIWD